MSQLSCHTSSSLAGCSLPCWDNQLWTSQNCLELVALLKTEWLTHLPPVVWNKMSAGELPCASPFTATNRMCDKKLSSVAKFKIPAPIISKRSLLTSGRHVVLNSLGISTGLVSLHISLYRVQTWRNNAHSLSVSLSSMTGRSGFFICWMFASR